MNDDAAILVRVAENGRLSIPAKQRKALGLEDGGLVSVRVEDGEIRIRTARTVMTELQQEAARIFAGTGTSTDDLLRERRDEAKREG
jgi:AbrB family looped-hinge helix DNA binding protein